MSKAILWGIITGITCGAWMLAEYYLGWHSSPIGNYTGFIAILFVFFGLFFAIRQTREKEFGGYIDYKTAVKAGMKATLCLSVIIALFTYIYYEFVNPGFVNYLTEVSEKYWKEMNYSEKDIQTSLTKLREAYEPSNQIQKALFLNLVMGMIISLVFSLFLKRKPKELMQI